MSKKTGIMLAIASISALCASEVVAADASYIGVQVGSILTSVTNVTDASGSLNTEFDPGYLAGITAGLIYEIPTVMNIDRVRIEGEIGYRSSELNRMKNAAGSSAYMQGTVSVTDFLLNGYLERKKIVDATMPLNLYVTAGLGLALANISTVNYNGTTIIPGSSDMQLAYQGGMGCSIDTTPSTAVDLGYRYMGSTPIKFKGVNAEYGSHTLMLAARYIFK